MYSLSDLIPLLQAAPAIWVSVRSVQGSGPREEGVVVGEDVVDEADAFGEEVERADAAVLLTEWNQFRNLDLARIKSLLKSPVFVDLRNVYTPADMRAAGFHYSSIGRPEATPEPPAAIKVSGGGAAEVNPSKSATSALGGSKTSAIKAAPASEIKLSASPT